MKTEPNDAAYARQTTDKYSTDKDDLAQTGLTKRELLAAMAMQGLLSKELSEEEIGIPDGKGTSVGERIAEFSVGFADALIKELNK